MARKKTTAKLPEPTSEEQIQVEKVIMYQLINQGLTTVNEILKLVLLKAEKELQDS